MEYAKTEMTSMKLRRISYSEIYLRWRATSVIGEAPSVMGTEFEGRHGKILMLTGYRV